MTLLKASFWPCAGWDSPISTYIVGVCAALRSHGQNHPASGSSSASGGGRGGGRERGTGLSVLAPAQVSSDTRTRYLQYFIDLSGLVTIQKAP